MEIWKRAHISKSVVPSPTEDNGWIFVNKVIEPKWCDGDILPTNLNEILDKAMDTENEHRLGDGA